MKYLKTYERYNTKLLDEILDKILSQGISSLTEGEKTFLDTKSK